MWISELSCMDDRHSYLGFKHQIMDKIFMYIRTYVKIYMIRFQSLCTFLSSTVGTTFKTPGNSKWDQQTYTMSGLSFSVFKRKKNNKTTVHVMGWFFWVSRQMNLVFILQSSKYLKVHFYKNILEKLGLTKICMTR